MSKNKGYQNKTLKEIFIFLMKYKNVQKFYRNMKIIYIHKCIKI